MSMEDLFKLARTATVAQLLERNDFATRFAAKTPISVLELLYPLMQGYDSVAIRSDVELGGTDQTFNLMLGRDVQRAYGQAEQNVLTMPILPGLDGVEKMSKSLGNQIGVTEPPDEMYGKTLSIPDSAMDAWFALLAIEDPGADVGPRDRKRALARGIVTRFHDAAAATAAEERFDRVFVAHEAPDEVPEVAVAVVDGKVHLPAVIADAFGRSRSDARRLIVGGGVKLAGETLGEADIDIAAERAHGALLQVGKRQFARLRVG
jgi:tyrosyl-tRNA synthetase